MSRYNYRSINNFGKGFHSSVSNPLTYSINDTLSQRFLHGGNSATYGQNSRPAQAFMSEYCSEHWDNACELASKNTNNFYPNNLVYANFNNMPYNFKGMTAGEALLRNTACRKYIVAMGNCVPKFEPFDPLVADSPMISHWVSETGTNNCIPVFGVDAETIDNDIVMNKILQKPIIALDVLINIYNTHKRTQTLNELTNTNLGIFFANNPNIFK